MIIRDDSEVVFLKFVRIQRASKASQEEAKDEIDSMAISV
jgi:hypothetical protein